MRLIIPAFLAATLAAPVQAQDSRFADPARIDRLVEGFAGQPIGALGGAKAPVDRRLRLAACQRPLAVDWHGSGGRTVSVTCEGTGGWRIFVNIQRGAAPASAAPVVARGEAVTIAVQGRGFSVQQQGEALEAGAVGEWIKVRSGKGRSAVRGKIVRPGLVVIPAG